MAHARNWILFGNQLKARLDWGRVWLGFVKLSFAICFVYVIVLFFSSLLWCGGYEWVWQWWEDKYYILFFRTKEFVESWVTLNCISKPVHDLDGKYGKINYIFALSYFILFSLDNLETRIQQHPTILSSLISRIL